MKKGFKDKAKRKYTCPDCKKRFTDTHLCPKTDTEWVVIKSGGQAINGFKGETHA